MALFGKKDESITANDVTTVVTTEGAPIGTWALVKGGKARTGGANAHFGNTSASSRANVDVNMFGNTTMSAFVNNMAVGVFAVDRTEIGVNGGPILEGQLSFNGSGYFANAAVTLTVVNGGSSGVVNAHANSTGRIDDLKVSTAGSGYKVAPLAAIDPPAAQTFNSNTALFETVTFNSNTGVDNANDFITISSNRFVNGDIVAYTVSAGNTALHRQATFNANTGVDNANDFITISSNPFANGDALLYLVAASNTAVDPLVNNTTYYVTGANSTGVKLAATLGGAVIGLTASATSETGHTLRRYDLISGNNYYVVAANSTGAKLSLTSGGAAINLTATAISEAGHNLTRNGFLEIGSNVYQNGDYVTYTVASGNTALTGLTSGNQYYVVNANTTGLRLSLTHGGTPISLVPGVSETGHSLRGQTATGKLTVAGGKNRGIAHTGYVVRREGTGGRAGRVHYEVLVAGGISNDSEDTVLPDS